MNLTDRRPLLVQMLADRSCLNKIAKFMKYDVIYPICDLRKTPMSSCLPGKPRYCIRHPLGRNWFQRSDTHS